jgi:hypothetical protein
VHAAARQLDTAERYYSTRSSWSPQSELVLTDLAITYASPGRTDKAIDLYNRILAS